MKLCGQGTAETRAPDGNRTHVLPSKPVGRYSTAWELILRSCKGYYWVMKHRIYVSHSNGKTIVFKLLANRPWTISFVH